MAGTRAGISGYEDLKSQAHLMRNLVQEVDWLVSCGESLLIALARVGVSKNTYDKWMERNR